MKNNLSLDTIKMDWAYIIKNFKEKREIIICSLLSLGSISNFNDDVLTICFNSTNIFAVNKLNEHRYKSLIDNTISEILNHKIETNLVVNDHFISPKDTTDNPLTLDTIKMNWASIIEKFKEKREMIICSLLLLGKLTNYTDNELTITFCNNNTFAVNRLNIPKNIDVINNTIFEVLNQRVTVNLLTDDTDELDIKLENLITDNHLNNPKYIFSYSTFSELYSYTLNKLISMPYDEYLQSEHWEHFRKEAISYFNGKCALCKSTCNLNLHHKSYENRGRETFDDVILLCKHCHNGYHKYKNF